MKLKDVASRLFKNPPVIPREALPKAAQTPRQAMAEKERAQQHRDLADRPALLNEQRAKAALEKPEMVNTPHGASQIRSKEQIEKIAEKATDAQQERRAAEINLKTEDQLIADAEARPLREAAAAKVAEQAKADAARGENNRKPANEMAKVNPAEADRPGLAAQEAAANLENQPVEAAYSGGQGNAADTPEATAGMNIWQGEEVHTPEEWAEIERLIAEQDRAAILDDGRTHTPD
jgi:hypothetical protein